MARSNSIPYGGTRTSGSFKIGGDSETGFTDYFNGILDEVRFCNRALSQAEVQKVAALGSSKIEPPLRGFVMLAESRAAVPAGRSRRENSR